MKQSDLIFGMDVGVASLGFSVIGENYDVLDSVSYLFSEANPTENATRRSMRQMKRGTRRRHTRIEDFCRLWKSFHLPVAEEPYIDVLRLRVKGLSEELTLEELYAVLLNNLKHRGISYLDDADDDGKAGSSDYAKGLLRNQASLQEKYPCEIQLERLNTYGSYRGLTQIEEDGEKITLSNVFTTSAYRAEIEKLLEVQKGFHKELTDDLIAAYMDIFNRKRKYYEGPGNELSRTDYGKYTTKKNPDGSYHTDLNIFDKLIGKCSVYPEERRAAGASYTAQEFNVLNDLNNLRINGEKLTEDDKHKIVQEMKTAKTVSVPKIISKVIGEKIETIEGARVDKDYKEIYSTFDVYNKLRKALEEIGFDITSLSREELDEIGQILTLNTDKESILNAVNESAILTLPEEVVEVLIAVRKKDGSLFGKWHSFSLKIMNELIPAMYEQPKNQMQLLTEMGVFKSQTDRFKDATKIPADEITGEIYNPVVAKSVRMGIRVLNAWIQKYGYPKEIVIEMPREKNSDEEKKAIEDMQKKNEKELEFIIKKIKSETGFEILPTHFKEHKKLKEALKLWNEQDGICIYSGRPISVDDLVHHFDKLEIDHIIPLSISFDDSRTNKVLVYHTENQNKGNRTPFIYLSGLDRDWNYDKMRARAKELTQKKEYPLSKRKLENLTNESDITKVEVLQGFINRNLNDTRYASRVLLNTLQDYFSAHEDCSTKVKVIRGSFTAQMRKNLRLSKDRDASYAHHATDAVLIAYSQMGYDAYHKLQDEVIDFETGEILNKVGMDKVLSEEEYRKALYEDKWLTLRENIIEAEKNVRFWHQTDKKVNRALCKQTIRGTRTYDDTTYKINKINIFDMSRNGGFATFKNKIEKGKEADFLVYRNDPKTWEQIMQIYETYKDQLNPFAAYEKETGDFVRKYSKNHDGPRIQILKYTDGEVGSCIDISHKYGHEKGSKKVILEGLNPYRTDVYYNEAEKSYLLVGVKYADIKASGDHYVIDEEAYARILVAEKMISEGQTRNDFLTNGYEFRFSLYKNDIIQYEKGGQIYEERFLSRTMPKQKNYVETKPVFCSKYENRNIVGLNKVGFIRKILTDIYGKHYICEGEKFRTQID